MSLFDSNELKALQKSKYTWENHHHAFTTNTFWITNAPQIQLKNVFVDLIILDRSRIKFYFLKNTIKVKW